MATTFCINRVKALGRSWSGAVLCERKLQGAAWQSSSPRLVPAAFVPRRGAVPGRKGHPGLEPLLIPWELGLCLHSCLGDTPVASGTHLWPPGPQGHLAPSHMLRMSQLITQSFNSLSSSYSATNTAKDFLAVFLSLSYYNKYNLTQNPTVKAELRSQTCSQSYQPSHPSGTL